MSLKIMLNGKECRSPIVKYGLAVSVLFGTVVISAFIIFVLLPIIGVSIAATLGLMVVAAAGIFAALITLALGTAILSTIIVFVDALLGKFRHR